MILWLYILIDFSINIIPIAEWKYKWLKQKETFNHNVEIMLELLEIKVLPLKLVTILGHAVCWRKGNLLRHQLKNKTPNFFSLCFPTAGKKKICCVSTLQFDFLKNCFVLRYPFIPFLPCGGSFFLLGQTSVLHPTLLTWLSYLLIIFPFCFYFPYNL